MSALKAVGEWNRNHPVGTPVIVKRDSGVEERTTTRSVAWKLGLEPVILLEGISGCYSLKRVRPAPTGDSDERA